MAYVKVQDPSMGVLLTAVIRSYRNSMITASRSERLAVGDRAEAPPNRRRDQHRLRLTEAGGRKALNKLLDVAYCG